MQNLNDKKIAIFCVGNKLMLDDGIGPAIYEELVQAYDFPPNVQLFDVGCMSYDLLNYVDEYDYLITVDALDGTGQPSGTVFEFAPEDAARHSGAMASLHDLRLVDLFDAAMLVGYSAAGKCFGMQVENRAPALVTVGLTQPCYEALSLLVDTVLAHLVRSGVRVRIKASGEDVQPGWHHVLVR